ncbi:MAG: hypothetical protein DHS20C19_29790 [Acidimicrobiales bacterium]|nr:MAG: hypothetical protein DHS20C19_29790 [Acidimicrobiales bacterium]
MCGNHRPDGSPVDHHHHDLPVFLPQVRGPRQWRRRAFLGEVGKGTVAFAVFAPAFIAACSDDGGTTAPGTTSTTATTTTTTAPPTGNDTTPTSEGIPAPPSLEWARTDLGFVSAYVLARGTEAAIVDTGTPGSAADIGETLAGIGLGYGDVRHVFLTHLHGDHIGSISEVMEMADGATAHAGEADIAAMGYDPINVAADGRDLRPRGDRHPRPHGGPHLGDRPRSRAPRRR